MAHASDTRTPWWVFIYTTLDTGVQQQIHSAAGTSGSSARRKWRRDGHAQRAALAELRAGGLALSIFLAQWCEHTINVIHKHTYPLSWHPLNHNQPRQRVPCLLYMSTRRRKSQSIFTVYAQVKDSNVKDLASPNSPIFTTNGSSSCAVLLHYLALVTGPC